jgi:hypothetical protein
MKSFGAFIRELVSDWSSGITGAASIPFTLLCLFASGKAQRIGYAVTAAVLLLFSAYRTWLKEYSRANSQSDRADEALAKPRITAAEWQALAEQFKLPHSNTRADYQTMDGITTWSVVVDPNCAALCRKAGAMLRNTPILFASMQPPVSDGADDEARWLEYLRQRFGADSSNYGMNPDTNKIVAWFGSVSSIHHRSAIACTEFSAALI